MRTSSSPLAVYGHQHLFEIKNKKYWKGLQVPRTQRGQYAFLILTRRAAGMNLSLQDCDLEKCREMANYNSP
jgi:hypothetical protein